MLAVKTKIVNMATFNFSDPTIVTQYKALAAKVENPGSMQSNGFLVDQTFAAKVAGTPDKEGRYPGSTIEFTLEGFTLNSLSAKVKNGISTGGFKAEGIATGRVGSESVNVKMHLGVAALAVKNGGKLALKVQAGKISMGRNSGSIWLSFTPADNVFATPDEINACLDAMVAAPVTAI